MDISQTLLPGVGVRYDMMTRKGVPVSVVVHREGICDIAVASKDDPDEVRLALTLTEDETDALTDVLGAHRIVERVADLTHEVPGLESARLMVDPGGPFDGRTLGDMHARTRTGCSIVALVRGGDVIAAPTPAESLMGGDILVATGSSSGLDELRDILRTG